MSKPNIAEPTREKSNTFSNKSNANRFPSLRDYAHFCRPYRYRFAWTMFVFTGSSAFLSCMPVYIGRLVDILGGQPINHHDAWFYALVLVGLSALHTITWRIGEFSFRKLVNPISFAYETRLFQAVIQKPYPYFVDKFTGKVSSYITTLSQELKGLLDEICFNYMPSLVNVIAVLLILSSINWQTGAVYVTGLLGMVMVGRILLRKNNVYKKIETDTNATKNGHVVDAVANFATIKSFQTERQEIAALARAQSQTLAASQRSFLWVIYFWASMSAFVREAIWPAVILMNLVFLLQGQITLGQFTTVVSTALIFTTTIWEVVWYISQFNLKVAKTDEAFTYLFPDGNISVPVGTDAQQTDASFLRSFDIKHLTFAYPDKDDVDVLQDISLHIRQGERIGIVGKSGSGKSTLTKLLLGYYETGRDVFYFDGSAVPAETVAAHVAFVPQDTTLFHRTISQNIAYAADADVSVEAVERAARQAHAHEFITKLNNSYDTLVGERGVKLSGGQRQRIAIARAILKDAPLLVLDEATSALDSESELLIQQALEKLWQGKTVIAIAHRLSTLRKMDRIIVMDEGKIVESGTHQELLEAGGTYATLWSHQSGGFIEE
ncbi:ABC transporter ATP-binding protein [Candidatus Saccharibacteria bacterium]|nr:ABC transporter ATP-binding protein [Candidatus Saccharibacteria bacterium]